MKGIGFFEPVSTVVIAYKLISKYVPQNIKVAIQLSKLPIGYPRTKKQTLKPKDCLI